MSYISAYPFDVFNTAYQANVSAPRPTLSLTRLYLFQNDSGSQHWSDIATDIAAGRTPIISIKFSGLTWTQVTAGSADAALDTRIPAALSLDISGLAMPPRIAFHHEPEGDDPTGPAGFNAMNMHLVERYKGIVRAAGWDLCFISTGGVYAGDNGNVGWQDVTNWNTAIAGIDITRCYADVYEKSGSGAYNTAGYIGRNPATNLSSRFRIYMDWCVAHGYTAGCPEFGMNQRADDPTGQLQADWLQLCADWSRHTEAEFYIYYDRVVGEGGATSNTAITHGGVLSSPSANALTSFSHLGAAVVPPSNTQKLILID